MAKDKHIHIGAGDTQELNLVMFEQAHHCVAGMHDDSWGDWPYWPGLDTKNEPP